MHCSVHFPSVDKDSSKAAFRAYLDRVRPAVGLWVKGSALSLGGLKKIPYKSIFRLSSPWDLFPAPLPSSMGLSAAFCEISK